MEASKYEGIYNEEEKCEISNNETMIYEKIMI